MPEEEYWNSFFDAECIVRLLFGEGGCRGDAAEIGSGYGTFTFPAALHTSGVLHAFDIEKEMTELLQARIQERQVTNIIPYCRDVMDEGTGLAAAAVSHVMIYNLLHIERPELLLNEAIRILHPGGVISIIHWRSDIPTPRGPSLVIRPTPPACRKWLEQAGFTQVVNVSLESCGAFHFGMFAVRGE